MYGLITAQLARRGFQAAARQSVPDGQNPDQERLELLKAVARAKSPGTLAMLVVTSLVFLLLSVAVEYAIRHVVGTLAAIEHVQDESSLEFELDGLLDEDEDGVPESSSSGKDYEDVRIPVDNAAAKSAREDTQKLFSAKERLENGGGTPTQTAPVTSSILSALRYLRRNGGIRSCFRGFKTFTVWFIINTGLVISLDFALGFLPSWLSNAFSFMASSVITAPLHCSWTHTIVRVRGGSGAVRGSTANPASGLRRYLPGVWSRHLVLPSIRLSVLIALFSQAAFGIEMAVLSKLPKEMSFVTFTLLGFAAPLLFMTVAGLLVIVPVIIALARVETSLLPEGEDVLVAFDRRSAMSRSRGVWWKYLWVNLSPIGAWKMFDRETYWRVMTLYVKFGAIALLIVALMIAALVLELYVVLNGQIRLIALMPLPV